MLEQEKISRIKVLLKAHPKGLTITEISSALKINRNSAAKYLEILQITGQVESKSYGTARAFFLSHRLPISALVSISSDLVLTLDEHNRILFVNEGFCRVFAARKEDVEGSHIVDIFKMGMGSDNLPSVISDLIADQEKVREVRLTRDSGDLFFKIKSMKTVFDDGSRGITIIMEDVTREKRDKIELAAKESRYRGIVEDQTEFIVRFLPGGIVTYANPAYSLSVRKKPEELPGTDFLGTIHAEDRQTVDRHIRSLSQKNPVTTFECRSSGHENETRWIAWTVRALFDDQKNPAEYQAVGQDITEKKEASEKLHLYMTQMLFFSKKLQQFIELPPEENIYHAIGAGLSEILPEALIAVSSCDPETATMTIKAVVPEKERNCFIENTGREPEGMKVHTGESASPETTPAGKVCPLNQNLYGMFIQQIPADICERLENSLDLGEYYSVGLMWNRILLGNITLALRKGEALRTEPLVEAYIRAAAICLKRAIAENALKESENLYRTVIENIEDIFYRSDLKGNLIMASPNCVRLLGYSSFSEIPGRNTPGDLYMEPAQRDEFLAGIIATGSVRNREVVLKRKDGSPLYVSATSYLYHDKDGTVLGIEGVLHDISERKAADKKIQQYIGEMEFLSQKLLDFMQMGPSGQIYDQIASDLRHLAPDSIVVVNSFDPRSGTIRIRSIVVNESQLSAIKNALGREPVGCEFRVDEAGTAAFRTGMLIDTGLSIFEILFKTIPEPVCTRLGSELDVGKIFVIGFARGDEIMGNAAILLGRGQRIPNLRLIETYAREAAIALQRLNAEEARRRSDEIFHNLAQCSPLPIALIEPDGTYRYINESFIKTFGYDLDDFRNGREWFRLIIPDPAERREVVATWKSDLVSSRAGYSFARTYPVRCKDGTVKEIIFRLVTLSGGTLCIVCEDITERNKAEQTHRLLSSIIESTSDAVIGKDSNGTVISWNRAAEQLYGYSEHEMVGQHISRIIPEDRTVEMEDIFNRIVRGESVSNLETLRIRKDGRLIDVSVTISPITDDTGRVIGASTIARDITRNKAEERLRMSEEQYRSLVENISVGIYRSTGDPKGRFIWGNSSLVCILGYPSLEDLRKIGIADLFVEHDGRKRLLDSLKREGFVKNREIALRRADGGTAWVLVTALARFDTAGSLSCINGIVEDITAQRQAEHRVQIMDKQMQDILAGIPDPVVIANREGRVIAWNAAMEELTGVQKTAALGRDDFDTLFPFYDPARPSVLSLMDAPDDTLEREYPGAYRKGSAVIAPVRDPVRKGDPPSLFTIHVSPLINPQGERIGAMQIIRAAGPEIGCPSLSRMDPVFTGTEKN